MMLYTFVKVVVMVSPHVSCLLDGWIGFGVPISTTSSDDRNGFCTLIRL